MFNAARDFWRSKSTWNGIGLIINTSLTHIFNRPDLLPMVAGLHAGLQVMFSRDTAAKTGEKITNAVVAACRDGIGSPGGLTTEDAKLVISELTRQLGMSVPAELSTPSPFLQTGREEVLWSAEEEEAPPVIEKDEEVLVP